MTEAPHVIIAGGGIGGLALAQGLRRAGVGVAVYERDRHRTDRLQGYRIHINPHGSRALRELLPERLFDAFVATSGKGGNDFTFCTEHLTELLHLDAEITTGGSRAAADSHYGVSRITLRQILLSGLDDVVHYDKEFRHYEHESDGRITAHFADGSRATGDVLVGADGVHSGVRKQYLPHAERVDTGIVTIVGKYPLTESSRAGLSDVFTRGPVSIMPPRDCGMFVAPHEFDSAPDTAHGITTDDAALPAGTLFDNTRPYVFWAYAARRDHYATDRPLESLTGAELHDLARRLTATWGSELRRLVDGTDTDTVTRIPIGTAVPVEQWPTTNVTLLGDAIHSMTPFRGIGANTALRDAAALCRQLVATARTAYPLLDGIRTYETAMIDYGFTAVRDSLKTANMAVSANRTGRIIGKTMFRTLNALPPLKRKVFANFGNA